MMPSTLSSILPTVIVQYQCEERIKMGLIGYNPMNIDPNWSHQLLDEMLQVGAHLHDQYAPIVTRYANLILPFETRRLQLDHALLSKNTTHSADIMELLTRLEMLKKTQEKLKYTLEKKIQRINDLQRKIGQKDQLLLENSRLISSLQLSNSDYVALLDRCDTELAQVEKDKQSIMQKFEAKNTDYNLLLANYTIDKNLLTKKLNQLEKRELRLQQKEQELKAEQFYLAKQWEEFNDKAKHPQKSFIGGRMHENDVNIKDSKEDLEADILRTPLKKMVKHHQSEVYDISFNYSGSLLASCGGDRIIKVYDVSNLKPAASISSHSAETIFMSVALNYSGQRLLAGSTDKTVSIYHTENGKQLHSFHGHGDRVNSVTWSSSGDKMISGSQDKQMKVWDVEKANVLLSVGCGKGVRVVKSMKMEPIVFSGHSDGSVRVYSMTQGNSPVSQVRGIIDYPISSLALTNNRHQIAVTSLQGSAIHILDLKMNRSIAKFEHADFFNSSAHCALSPSETLLLAGNCDGSIYYWNRHSGELLRTVSGHVGATTALSYSFTNRLLASADKEGSLILWE